MQHTSQSLALIAGLVATVFGLAALPARAASSASSAASDSASTSLGSVSTSFEKSSNSSSKGDKTAAGDYKVVEIVAAAGRPQALRVTLRAAADGEEFYLYLPQEAVDRGQLAPGKTVTAKQREYGLEFARAEDQQAFFLVLNDESHRELKTSVVRL